MKRKTPKINVNKLETPDHFELIDVLPKTTNQSRVFDAFDDGKNLVLHGLPGTGKTFISLYLALDEVFTKGSPYKKIIILRSAVSSRDIGFLPGNIKEKSAIYEEPYKEICAELCNRGDAYDVLTKKGILEFHVTSFMRGLTLKNCIVIIDEIQNMTFQEIDTVITRMGKNCKMLFLGDFFQCDIGKKKGDDSGILKFLDIISKIRSFSFTEFNADDIVRSMELKQYILARQEYEKENSYESKFSGLQAM